MSNIIPDPVLQRPTTGLSPLPLDLPLCTTYFARCSQQENKCMRSKNCEVLSYSYITSTSKISLLLYKTKGKAQGLMLITMIPYECLRYNCFMSHVHCLGSKTEQKRFLSILLHLIAINTLKLFIDLLDGFTYSGLSRYQVRVVML